MLRRLSLAALLIVACAPDPEERALDAGADPDGAPAPDAMCPVAPTPDAGEDADAAAIRPDGAAPDAGEAADSAATSRPDAAAPDAGEAADSAAASLPDAATSDAGEAEDSAAASLPDAAMPDVCGALREDRGAGHIDVGTCVIYADNPPSSGPHYGRWAPAREYPQPLDRRYWVHNLEHGWLVLLYRPDADPAAVDDLREAMGSLPDDPDCPGFHRVLLTADPALDSAVAAVAWRRVLEGDRLAPEAIRAFFAECRVAAPELRVCANGSDP